MRILACGVVWNEIDILPYLLKYLKAQGVDVFIFDNDSTDGTWEYLQDNKIKCERLSSGGKFSLVQFIKKMTAKWHELKPDWCIYLDADEFPLTFQFPTLKRLIEIRDEIPWKSIDIISSISLTEKDIHSAKGFLNTLMISMLCHQVDIPLRELIKKSL